MHIRQGAGNEPTGSRTTLAPQACFRARPTQGWAVLVWAGYILTIPLIAATLPQYAEGDRLQADVVTPLALEVVDPLRTEQARQEATSRIPPIYRFETTMATQAEADLRRVFGQKHRAFLLSMTQAAKRSKLDETTVNHPSFDRFVDWFRQQHPDFRLPHDLARAWALHEPDTDILNAWAASLRDAMNQCVGDRTGLVSDTVRMVPAPSLQTHITERMVERNGVTLGAREFLTLEQARSKLQASLAKQDTEVGLFLQRFLRDNCFLEETLTEKARLSAVTDVLALNRYEAGEIVGRRGQVVDGRMKAAIDLLRAEMSSGSAVPDARRESAEWEPEGSGWSRLWSDPLRFEKMTLLSLAGLASVSIVGALVLGWMVKRKRRKRRPRSRPPAGVKERETEYTVVMNPQRNETIFLPMQETENTGSGAAASEEAPVTAAAAEAFWQQRAAEAERRAEEILGMVRAGLAPQLAKQMMHRLVQELISQRAQWLRTQRVAESDLEAIEKRFLESHRQLQARLLAFEKRAVDLETALARKAEENSELIKAHISMTQQQLKAKEQTEQPHWN